MMETLGLLARTFGIGIAVAAPVGAMGMLCVQRTLTRGWRVGMATGAGIATADGMYAAVAAFGVAALSASLVAFQTPLRLLGGAYLVYLGFRSILRRSEESESDAMASRNGRSLATTYLSAVGLTLTNPMTIIAFGAVFATAGLASRPGSAAAVWSTAGVMSGSLFWWFVLVTATAAAHGVVGSALRLWVNRASGLVIAGFGVLAIASVLVR